MDQNILNILMSLAHRKDTIIGDLCSKDTASCSKKWLTSEFYLDAIMDEVEEVRPHLKDNNSVYLEDELWDVLWDYINLIFLLEKEWRIDASSVFKKMLEKYEERVHALENNVSWSEVKKTQKEELLKDHNKKYNA